MGFAIIWVMLYHVGIEVSNPVISYLKETGYGGVDIFVFCTGVGCYYSLSKNSDTLDFFFRRATRIYPSYWPFLPIWFAYKYFTGEFHEAYVIGNIIGVQSFTGNWNEVTWYISALFLFYMICPIIFAIVERYGDDIRRCIYVFAFILFGTVAFWNSLHMNMSTTRIPLLFLGMVFAKLAKRGMEMPKHTLLYALLGVVIGDAILVCFMEFMKDKIRPWGLWWYPFIIIAPCICVIISFVSNVIEGNKIGCKILKITEKIGKMSFELLLTHLVIFDITERLLSTANSNYKDIIWLGAFGASMVCGFILFTISEAIRRKVRRER